MEKATAGITAEELTRHPEGKWSGCEVLEHLSRAFSSTEHLAGNGRNAGSRPASGWSSYDAWLARFSGIQYVPFMMELDSGEVIPSCSTATYLVALYLPKMKIVTPAPDRKNDGSKNKIKVTLEHFIESIFASKGAKVVDTNLKAFQAGREAAA